MLYHITHHISYTYNCPVLLAPHTVHLRPRCDVTQTLHQFSLSINPEPKRWVDNLDLDGNAVARVWFAEALVTRLTVEAVSEVETRRTNPFDYLLEPWAVQLPIDYPASLFDRLQPYLAGDSQLMGGVDPVAVQLGQEIWEATAGNVVSFLSQLTDRIYRECGYQLRETGAALPAGITWRQKTGSCRDYAVLFMEVCRAVGLAARFVSGYQEGDVNSDDRHLHAWAEVYLPGAGWRSYDPTQGLATADTHIALVSSPTHRNTAPVTGTLKQAAGVTSQMEYRLRIKKG